jgi:uncharacterized membrane-anchored protein
MLRVIRIPLIGALIAGLSFVVAADQTPAEEPVASEEEASEAEGPALPELTYQTGTILLPNKVATLNLNDNYRYLDPTQTETLLVAWGNPPGSETLGSVVPAALSPFDDGGWAVIVTYLDEGHVDDADAKEIDYDDLLKDMQEDTREGSKERVEAGYGSVDLVGWAQPPHYDALARKLHWAQELKFGESEVNTLNYEVRVLGREGVLSLNAVAGMPQVEMVARDMQGLLTMAAFNEGHRYEEFNKDTDKMAAYGIGALVAGGLAAKAGLFAKLGALLIAAKKFIIIGVVALGGLLVRIFRGRKQADA